MILICNTIMLFALIIAFPVVLPIILTSKKRRKTVLQRLGFVRFFRQKGKSEYLSSNDQPIWIHALSVGETFSAVELVKKLKQSMPHRKIFFSVSTATGFDESQKRLANETDYIFFYPYDLLFVVRKAIRQVSPALFVLVESDIWPTFLLELKKKNIPAVLVNARLSSSSFAGYKKLSGIMKPVLNSFKKICVQSDEQGKRFLQIGVKPDKICVTGNMKFDQKTDQISAEHIDLLRKSLGISKDNRVFLAGSTHRGEEPILLESFKQLRENFSDLVLVIVPRNPDRADEVFGLASESGLFVKKMSQDKSDFPQVLVVDFMGVLSKLYAVANIAFVGGSLVPFGGHNPLEPAAFGKPVLLGPDMSDFPEISRLLLNSGGAIEVKNAAQIYEMVKDLLTDPLKARKIGENAFEVFQSNQGAVEKTVSVIKQIENRRN